MNYITEHFRPDSKMQIAEFMAQAVFRKTETTGRYFGTKARLNSKMNIIVLHVNVPEGA